MRCMVTISRLAWSEGSVHFLCRQPDIDVSEPLCLMRSLRMCSVLSYTIPWCFIPCIEAGKWPLSGLIFTCVTHNVGGSSDQALCTHAKRSDPRGTRPGLCTSEAVLQRCRSSCLTLVAGAGGNFFHKSVPPVSSELHHALHGSLHCHES